MKKINILLASVFAFCATACDLTVLDNYKAPDAVLKGQILDSLTNEPIPLPVQGGNGTIIRLMEQNTGATQSHDFRALQDGSYSRSNLFNADYKMTVEGPFTSPCVEFVTVNGNTSFDVHANPLSRIKASASVSGKSVTVTYAVTPSEGVAVSSVEGYWNYAPGVDNKYQAENTGKQTATALAGTFTFDLTNDATYKINLPKIQSNKNRIYLRVGARASSGAYNFSTTMEVTVQ